LLVVVVFLTKSVVVTFLADSEVVVAFLVQSRVDEQSNMGAHLLYCVSLSSVFRCHMRRSPPRPCTLNIGCCFSCLHVQNLES